MTNYFSFILIFLIVVNLTAFFVMYWDKSRSVKTGAGRVSEGFLFFMATMFASLGVYAGMFTFRHKTRKWYFVVCIPVLILENAAFLYLVYSYL